jgi:hypothetical protein
MAPSGVLTSVSRRAARRAAPPRRAAALTAIVAGALLSGVVAPPTRSTLRLPLPAVGATDFAVTRRCSRGWCWRLASSLVGPADSILFLWLAFAASTFAGQILGKL